MIRKSSLLARLIYGGEKLRPTICPEHKGKWSGLEFPAMPGFKARVCEHGCNLTGWIPEKSEIHVFEPIHDPTVSLAPEGTPSDREE